MPRIDKKKRRSSVFRDKGEDHGHSSHFGTPEEQLTIQMILSLTVATVPTFQISAKLQHPSQNRSKRQQATNQPTTSSMAKLAVFHLIVFCVVKGSSFIVHGPQSQPKSAAIPIAASTSDDDETADFSTAGFVLLAGGKGSRMKADMPKQFLPLEGAPILHHCLDLLLERLPNWLDNDTHPPVTLVIDPIYQDEYAKLLLPYGDRVHLASPGAERQDSVQNGVTTLLDHHPTCQWVAIHDAARPLVTLQELRDVVRDAQQTGTAAVLAVPCKATIKQSVDGRRVDRTVPRDELWEVHTPQVIRAELLQQGFARVQEENWQVTDDVSIVEQMGETVRLTRGEYTNLKITTPEDMNVAAAILRERNSPPVRLQK